jgi:hypothetical protein
LWQWVRQTDGQTHPLIGQNQLGTFSHCDCCHSGLPDGLFSNKKIPLWVNFGWKMLVYFMVIRNILQSFGIFYGHWVMLWKFGVCIFPRFGILCQEKSGNSATTASGCQCFLRLTSDAKYVGIDT